MHTGQSKGNVTKWGQYETSCAILFGFGFEAGFHIFILAIHKLQNAKDEKSYYQIGKIPWTFFYQ